MTESYEFIRIDGVNKKYIVLSDVPDQYLSADTYDLYFWVWPTLENGYEKKPTIIGNYVVCEVYDSVDNYMLVVVNKNAPFNSMSWNNVKYKTCDFLRVGQKVYSADQSKWVVHVPGE